MSDRILVTGASGTVGTELARALQQRKADFAVMTSNAERRFGEVPAVVGNFADEASLERAFQGIDTLFLLLPLVPGKVQLARNAVAAAKAAGVTHIVRSSGAGADPASPVSIARLQGEIDRIVMESGLDWTIVRPAMFMQNHVNYNAARIRSGSYYAPHGNGAIALVDVRDVAEVAARILTEPSGHAGKTYDLTGPAALTDAEQMAEISRVVGRPVQYVDVPEQAALDAMQGMGMPAVVIDWMTSLNHVVKQGWAAATTDHVQRLTGHPPRTFAAFVEEHADAWR